ncbi:hypothetical protein SAMN05444722_2060 [Rhodovulum sp. ES.010]|nr:hypothetical protein SAMN05444722_2060 [Rhodovulum sp. ES.010]
MAGLLTVGGSKSDADPVFGMRLNRAVIPLLR